MEEQDESDDKGGDLHEVNIVNPMRSANRLREEQSRPVEISRHTSCIVTAAPPLSFL